jgi:predicted secreted protein
MSEVLGTDPGSGLSGFGTTLQGATTGVLGMITRINLSGFEVAQIDVTTMNSPGRWRQFVAGLKDARDMAIDLVYERVNMTVIMAALGAANESWTIAFPDGSTFVVSGHISRMGTQIPFDDKISQTITIKFNGAPVWNAASGA